MTGQAVKRCTRCNATKPLDDFYRNAEGRFGRQSHCKACMAQVGRETKRRNRQRNAELKRGWKAQNRGAVARQAQEYKRRYPEKRRAHSAVRNEVRYNRWPAANTMVCEICQEALAAHYHHHLGYAKEHRFDVIAVCVECHASLHANVAAELTSTGGTL